MPAPPDAFRAKEAITSPKYALARLDGPVKRVVIDVPVEHGPNQIWVMLQHEHLLLRQRRDYRRTVVDLKVHYVGRRWQVKRHPLRFECHTKRARAAMVLAQTLYVVF